MAMKNAMAGRPNLKRFHGFNHRAIVTIKLLLNGTEPPCFRFRLGQVHGVVFHVLMIHGSRTGVKYIIPHYWNKRITAFGP